MKNFLPIFFSLFACMASVAAELPEKSRVPGALVQAIPVALKEFERTRLDVDDYEVVIYEEQQAILVLFLDPERKEDVLGSSPRMREFSVEVDRTSFKVLRSYYMR